MYLVIEALDLEYDSPGPPVGGAQERVASGGTVVTRGTAWSRIEVYTECHVLYRCTETRAQGIGCMSTHMYILRIHMYSIETHIHTHIVREADSCTCVHYD